MKLTTRDIWWQTGVLQESSPNMFLIFQIQLDKSRKGKTQTFDWNLSFCNWFLAIHPEMVQKVMSTLFLSNLSRHQTFYQDEM